MGDASNWPYGFANNRQPPTEKRVWAFAGRKLAGKETAARYVAMALGASETHTYSDILYDTFALWGFDRHMNSRAELIALSDFMRGLKGQEAMTNVLHERLRTGRGTDAIIDGLRLPPDVDRLIADFGRPNVTLVWIEASADNRFERACRRKDKKGEERMARAQFDAEEAASTEALLEQIRARCDVEIDNNAALDADGNPQAMWDQLDAMLAQRRAPRL
ncbi:MAG: hypothetical protein QY323_05905 [Patescibacteria group bacterium]|nr:MAG: hypothetical protein QY323_05905 [Patescibacteria group bacterium]